MQRNFVHFAMIFDLWKVHLAPKDTPEEFLADILNSSQYIFVILSKHTIVFVSYRIVIVVSRY